MYIRCNKSKGNLSINCLILLKLRIEQIIFYVSNEKTDLIEIETYFAYSWSDWKEEEETRFSSDIENTQYFHDKNA